MRNLLPVVKPEIGFSLAENIDEVFDKKQWKKLLRQIEKDNPVIVDFIKKWAKEAKNSDAGLHSAIGGILVYKLLESQAEADKMDEDYC